MFSLSIPQEKMIDLIDVIGEVDFRIAEGSNERIQLEALIAHFTLRGRN